MIKKIISGGQTGAERAAIDVAIRFMIPHNGWIMRDREAELGCLADHYDLKELTTSNYSACVEWNVSDSDGTVIFTHGSLIGRSKLIQKFAKNHKKPFLHIDLNRIPAYNAVFFLRRWMDENKVKALNVTGSRTSKDPLIYNVTYRVIRGVYWIDRIMGQNQNDKQRGEAPGNPESVDEAVKLLISKLSLKDKTAIAKMSEDGLTNLHFSFGMYIRNRLLYPRNESLLESCRQVAMDKFLHWDQASGVIVKELWKRLRESHRLRVVK